MYFIFHGRNVRGRNVHWPKCPWPKCPWPHVLAKTSVAEMSVAKMSEHRYYTVLHELGFEKGRVLIQRRVFSACHNMLKKSISCIWASYFFLEYPFGTPSEIPAQDFNLLVNIDNFFPVFLLIIIGNSFHLFKFTLHLKNCLIGVTWGLSSK